MRESILGPVQDLARTVSGTLGRQSWFIRKTRPLYEAVLAAFGHAGAVPWVINGQTFHVDARSRHLFGHDYERPVAEFLRAKVRPGDICFDVGANVGVYVLQLGRLVSPTGKVVAFEPNPIARRIMAHHAELNGLAERLVTVPSAVAARSGEREFFSEKASATARLDAPNAALERNTVRSSVSVTSLDDFVERTGLEPRWVLMDIEGHELEALLGARNLIRRLRGRLGFVVEMHPGVWPGIGADREPVARLLSELGLRCEALSGQKDALGEYGHVYLF